MYLLFFINEDQLHKRLCSGSEKQLLERCPVYIGICSDPQIGNSKMQKEVCGFVLIIEECCREQDRGGKNVTAADISEEGIAM